MANDLTTYGSNYRQSEQTMTEGRFLNNTNTVTSNSINCLPKGTKNIYVNPLCGRNIHVNKNKLAAGGLDLKNLSLPPKKTNEKIYYNPKFLSTNSVPKTTEQQPTNVHVNPNYLNSLGHPPAIHVNRNFLTDTTSASSLTCTVPDFSKSHHTVNVSNSPVKLPNKYKLVNKQTNDENIPAISTSAKPSQSSKYKFVNSNKTVIESKNVSPPKIKMKSKYSIRQCPDANSITSASVNQSEIPKRRWRKSFSLDFKNVSKTKLIRRSTLNALLEMKKRKHSLALLNYKFAQKNLTRTRRRSLISQYKYVKSKGKNGSKSDDMSLCSSSGESVFKSVSLTKLVRKSVLQKHIESRRQVRSNITNLPRVSPNSYFNNQKLTLINSQYKFIRKTDITSKSKKDSLKEKRRKPIKVKISKKKSITSLTKALRKNNQLCVFFNRFGRCKGRDRGTCTKIHDPKYIAICKKLLSGECSSKDCLFSHDIRPEKMPTCLHYLAGLCTRSDCPFLHIKVNEKAPICNLFLQGFCADVYNCTKRHEYICPIFAEKGVCPKGKSCVYPHRSRIIRSKLLETDQKPLISNPKKRKNNDNIVKFHAELNKVKNEVISNEPSQIIVVQELKSNDNVDNLTTNESLPNGENSPKPFTRYFSMPFTFDPNCDKESEASSSDESN